MLYFKENKMSDNENQAISIATLPETRIRRSDCIRIVLVDDHQVVRQGVRAMLEIEQDMEIVADFGSAEEAIPQIEKLSPDIVLLDFRMPGMNGIEACRLLQAKGLRCDVIILTLYEEHFAEALRAGAKGYLPKDMKREELVETIRQVYRLKKSPEPANYTASFNIIDFIILSPAKTDRIMRFIEFAPSVLQGSVEQIVKLLDDSTAVTMKFEKAIKPKTILEKLQKISDVKVVKGKLEAKSKFLWPFEGTLKTDRSEKNQILITLV
jgi:DNA-binding NarL/FixJ family response regulator